MDPLAVGRSPVTVYLDAQLYARLKAQAHGCGACLQGYVVKAIRNQIVKDEPSTVRPFQPPVEP